MEGRERGKGRRSFGLRPRESLERRRSVQFVDRRVFLFLPLTHFGSTSARELSFFFFFFFLSATFLSDQISKALELSLVAARQTLALIRSKVELAFLESSAASSVDVEVEGEGKAMEI